MYGVLAGLPCRRIGVVDGMAASAATVPLMACHEVQIPANAIMMIHDPMTGAYGNAGDFTAVIEALNRVKATIVAAYAAKNSKMSAEEISAAMTATTYYSGADAVAAGFADTLVEAAPILNLATLDPATLKGAPEASCGPWRPSAPRWPQPTRTS